MIPRRAAPASSTVRVIGTCYICADKLFGYRAPVTPTITTDTRSKGVVRDSNGLRHGRCQQTGPGFGSERGVAPSDA